MMKNVILIVVLITIVGYAAWRVFGTKKEKRKCIGCPYGKECVKKKSCF